MVENINSLELENESIQRFRDKKRWQLALRRYILHGSPSEQYAMYFGLDSQLIREWVELQFDDDCNWYNFGSLWQLEHIIPITCFDYTVKEELKLCWSFINIRVERIHHNKNKGGKVDMIGAQSYFLNLHERTNYSLCLKMVEKIVLLEQSAFKENKGLAHFIIAHKEHLEKVSQLKQPEFNRYNRGEEVDTLLLEQKLFGEIS